MPLIPAEKWDYGDAWHRRAGFIHPPTQVLPAHNKQPRFITHVQINEENKLVAAAAWFNYLILYLLVQ